MKTKLNKMESDEPFERKCSVRLRVGHLFFEQRIGFRLSYGVQ